MKAKELLKPRYKVIADYPNSEHEIGEIIVLNENRQVTKEPFARLLQEPIIFLESDIDKSFPHIFKKLEWWEEREEKDMPSKITHKESVHKEVVNIDRWIFIDREIIGFQSDNIGVSVLDGWLPVD